MLRQTIKLAAASGMSLCLVMAGGSVALAKDNNKNKNDKDPSTVTICVQNNSNSNSIGNTTIQTGNSGSATVSNNKKGGSATSGDVNNTNKTKVKLTNTNDSTCPDGINTDSKTKGGSGGSLNLQFTSNTNNTGISNTTLQTGTSGSASVVCNTQGGSAVSGDVTNTNGTVIVVSNSNN